MMSDDELSTRLRNEATRHQASESLKAAVRTQIALQAAAGPTRAQPAMWPISSWRSAAAGLVCGVLLTLALTALMRHQPTQPELRRELVALHVQALGVGPLIEVASSDRHTVKPWYQGKLDYAPSVPDLSAAGYPLLGGRVDRLAGASVAALVYARDRHRIDATVLPVDADLVPQASQQRGFNLLHFSEAGMQVWLVSDIEASELQRFAAAWRAALLHTTSPAGP